jgi:hypothetical protein
VEAINSGHETLLKTEICFEIIVKVNKDLTWNFRKKYRFENIEKSKTGISGIATVRKHNFPTQTNSR